MGEENLKPWKWNPAGGGAAGFSTAMLNLFKVECTTCGLNQSSRPTCIHQENYYNGTYPAVAPPACWFTDQNGLPICTAKEMIGIEPVLNVLKDPKQQPAPPAPIAPEEPPIMYHAESDSLIAADSIADAEEFMHQGLSPASREQIVKSLLETVYNRPGE